MAFNSKPDAVDAPADPGTAPDTMRTLLIRALQDRYADIKARLSRHFAPDLVEDAMHETWLRLQRPRDISPVRDPESYLRQAIANTARNLRTARERRLDFTEVSELFAIADDAPGPDIIAGDRHEIARLQAALAELTVRQQEIFHETFLGDLSHHELAARHGVTVRTIQKELKRAVERCAWRLGKRKSFATGLPRLSSQQGEKE